MDCDLSAARIRNLEGATWTRYGELGVGVRALRLLKGHVEAGEDGAN